LIRNVVLQYFWTFSTKDIIGKTSLMLVHFFLFFYFFVGMVILS
jgi:hypothetical protein